jgi:hypothetical protein
MAWRCNRRGADLEPGDAVDYVATPGDHDDPRLIRSGADLAREGKAVLPGQD